MGKTVHIILVLAMFVAMLPVSSQAAVMNDYCVTPPFIQESIKPNLLFLLDNSSSMYDLAYVDKGKKHCSNSATACTKNSDCGGGTCSQFDRRPYYCYDETFSTANTYVGYFDAGKNYQYNFTSNLFEEVAGIPASCAVGGTAYCKIVAGVVHVNISPTDAAQPKYFYASGQYLNWLTASKFDVEKQVLTGGKYVSSVCSNDPNKSCTVAADCGSGNTCNAVASNFLQTESRGCVGQGYVKDANTSNFVNYNTGATNPNSSLDVTFLVHGPSNPYNLVAPSSGGQTYIDLFAGSEGYDYTTCQTAMESLATGGNADIKKDVDSCLASTTPELGTCVQDRSKSCAGSYAPDTPNCDFPLVGAHCSSNSAKACTVAADCVVTGSKSCQGNTGKVCTADTDCNTLSTYFCSAKHALTCSGIADATSCTVAAKKGTCSKKSQTSCSVDTDCISGKNNNGPCVGAIAAGSYGPCVVNVPGVNQGPCSSAASVDQGPCVPASGGYVGPCDLGTHGAMVKGKVAFQQSMQECWKIRGTVQTAPSYGFSNQNTVKGKCPDIYGGFKACSNNYQQSCTVDGDCGAGNFCLEGPNAIGPGHPALLCGIGYAGQYFEKNAGGAWVLKASATDENLNLAEYQFCNSFFVPTVTDPTDAPSDTSLTNNVPAILSGLGVESQMGAPIAQMAARVKKDTSPTGVVQDYSQKIRMGVMSFNFAGSKSEVTAGLFTAPKVCSNDSQKSCTGNVDCGPGNSCGASTNRDGGQMLYYINQGTCSSTTSTMCAKDAHCPEGETCVGAGVGTHATGMVNTIDAIRASSWTPFAEAFYNAIGYFAVDKTRDADRFKYSRANPADSANNIRLDSNDFVDNMNPSEYVCQANNILLISDGSSTMDQNSTVRTLVESYYPAPGSQTGTCSNYFGTKNLDDLAWLAKNRSINDFSTTSASTIVPTKNHEAITTYVVFNGASNGVVGTDECNSETLLTKTAVNGGTTLYSAEDPSKMRDQLTSALDAVSANATSGTAASILSNSEGSGASLLQALFYPKKEFDKINLTDANPTSTKWIGEIQSFWYYLDPFLQKTSIREDTVGDYKLNLKSDKVIQFYFDSVQSKTLVNKYSDLDGDGAADSGTPDVGGAGVSPDVVKSLWKAGRKLWERDLSSDTRRIFTGYNSTAASLPHKFSNLAADGFNTDSSTAVWDLLQIPAGTNAERKARATKLIDYIHGYDQVDDTAPCLSTPSCKYRPRKVFISACGLAECYREWKLGDIVSSTPKIASSVRTNTYDLAPSTGYNDRSYEKYINSPGYKNRGMAFVGANDGMLHAFKLGVLHELSGAFDKAQMNNADGTIATSASDLGREEWAYIPSQTLPYLKYYSDPNYNHIYFVDKSPLILDASIGQTGCAVGTDYSECAKNVDGSTWRTILIGGTGIGGAAREEVTHDAVKPPVPGAGFSSYFALDVTDTANPKYMWEFFGNTALSGSPAPKLGFATSGAAVVRISAKLLNADGTVSARPDDRKNGKWYAVFASGSLGPIDTVNHMFKGESDQPLRIFIVDLATGTLLRTIDCLTELGINNAFAGSLSSSVIDADRSNQSSNGYYSDDAVYIGYTEKDPATSTWTKGGVLRILTKESTDPAQWVVSKVIDNIGPVTSSVTKLQDRKNNNLWLFFGTGRFFYKNDDITTTRQAIYGVKEPCYSTFNRTMQFPVSGGTDNDIDQNCTDSVSGTIVDQSGFSTAPAATLAASAAGWKIVLDAKDTPNSFLTERVITDPLAAPSGAVFFTTFRPSSDLCKFGGDSLLWAVRYDSGGTPPATAMQGRALMQVSTGAFAEIKLSDAFRNPGSTRYDGRRLATPITGVPPTAQGFSLFSNPPPLKKMMHIREK